MRSFIVSISKALNEKVYSSIKFKKKSKKYRQTETKIKTVCIHNNTKYKKHMNTLFPI